METPINEEKNQSFDKKECFFGMYCEESVNCEEASGIYFHPDTITIPSYWLSLETMVKVKKTIKEFKKAKKLILTFFN